MPGPPPTRPLSILCSFKRPADDILQCKPEQQSSHRQPRPPPARTDTILCFCSRPVQSLAFFQPDAAFLARVICTEQFKPQQGVCHRFTFHVVRLATVHKAVIAHADVHAGPPHCVCRWPSARRHRLQEQVTQRLSECWLYLQGVQQDHDGSGAVAGSRWLGGRCSVGIGSGAHRIENTTESRYRTEMGQELTPRGDAPAASAAGQLQEHRQRCRRSAQNLQPAAPPRPLPPESDRAPCRRQ